MEVSKVFAQRNNYNSKLYNRMAKSIFHKPDKLEQSNIKLKKSYSQLNLIKDNIIKDMIYSHKNVPFCWKNKINYRQQVMNLIANDENFLVYLGNIGGKDTFSKNITSNITNIKKAKYDYLTKKNKITLFKNKSMNERDLFIYMTKLGKRFPIKRKLKEMFSENELKGKNKFNIESSSTYKFTTSEKKINFISQNIYMQLIGKKTKNSNGKKLHRSQSAIIRNYNKKYLDKDNFDRKKLNIKDKYALNQLESVNYFGPYFSYCPECGIRNNNFYKNIGIDTLIDIVGQIKKNKDEDTLRALNKKRKLNKQKN